MGLRTAPAPEMGNPVTTPASARDLAVEQSKRRVLSRRTDRLERLLADYSAHDEALR